jgi:alanyl-tRNA synthetase
MLAVSTLRIYYTEPARLAFDATVVAVEPADRSAQVVLDRTAFYPTSGGQPFDTGTLGTAQVVDVVDDEATGRILHVVEGLPPAVGDSVAGTVDGARRADHMQQHTGQHILSAAFDRLFGVRTESFHLGRDVSTIDLSRDVTRAELDRAESLANEVVWGNRPVSIRFVDEQEAARLPLRKAPARGGRLRLIDVTDFDLSACGGTHVAHTGEVGQIAVHGWERYKGGARIAFVCGRRALDAFRTNRDAVTGAVRALSVLPQELPDGIARLQAQMKDSDKRVRALQLELASHQGAALAGAAETIGGRRCVLAFVEGHEASTLKPLATSACAVGVAVAVVFSGEPAWLVACARAEGQAFDCGALVKALCTRFGGRGGGRPESAQGGGMAASRAELAQVVREALS